jgi:hypothetical protein
MFHDLESGQEMYIDPDAARQEYGRRFREHAAAITRVCGNLGIDLYPMTTDRPLELALFDFLNARMRRGRQISRRGAARLRGPT